jgi:hypothetical protein
LFAEGDSMPRAWARAVLDTAVRAGIRGDRFQPTMDAIHILSDLRDRPTLGLVIAIVSENASPNTSNLFTNRLAAFDDPVAWGAILSLERAGKLRAFDVAMAIRPPALGDSVVHERARDFLRRSLAVDSLSIGALLAVERLGMIELVPAIIDRLALPDPRGLRPGINETRTLVWLSGRSDAPVWSDSVPPRAVVDWWRRWWASTHGKATAVTTDEAKRTTQEWSKRFFAVHRR